MFEESPPTTRHYQRACRKAKSWSDGRYMPGLSPPPQNDVTQDLDFKQSPSARVALMSVSESVASPLVTHFQSERVRSGCGAVVR